MNEGSLTEILFVRVAFAQTRPLSETIQPNWNAHTHLKTTQRKGPWPHVGFGPVVFSLILFVLVFIMSLCCFRSY